MHTQRRVDGDLSSWNDQYKLSIANESTGERPWLGTMRLIAIYCAALNANEVKQNFAAGLNGQIVELAKTQPTATNPAKPDTPMAPMAMTASSASANDRVTTGLQVLYDFSTSSGPIVTDRSGVAPALNLKIKDMKSVKRSAGRLQISGKTLILL